MGNVPGIDLLPAHCALLERAADHFWDDGRVRAVILGGSLACSIADFYSDMDVYVVARDGFFDAVFDERDPAALILGSPLFRFTIDAIPGGSRDYIITYPGPVKLDLMYHRESEIVPAPKWGGCVALKDASGLIEDVLVTSRDLAPPTPTSEELLELDQNFWTLCWYVFGKIVRGELWEALAGIHTIRRDAFLPMRDLTAGRPHEGYIRLETKLDPEMAEHLTGTLAPLEAGALYEALQTAISLYCDLRESLFELRGLTFDPAPEEEIEDEMDRLWAARGT